MVRFPSMSIAVLVACSACPRETAGPAGGSPASPAAVVDGTSSPAARGGQAGESAPSAPSASAIRFAAFGDQGEGNAAQWTVARVLESVCEAQGCDFVLLLGDNFYGFGVESVSDPQWQDKFEEPYSGIDAPFYAVLGNHDGGARRDGVDLARGDAQVAYTARSAKWRMPARWYQHSAGPADFYALDTSTIFFDGGPFCPACDGYTAQQAAWLDAERAEASASRWRIAYGHHPVLSNGPHGSAGRYEGIPLVPYLSGAEIKRFFEGHVCGFADLYLAGHDHSRQWLQDSCGGTHLVISGGGATRTPLPGSLPVVWQDTDDRMTGFFWFEIQGDTMRVEAWNADGEIDHAGTIRKAGAGQPSGSAAPAASAPAPHAL